MGYLPRWFFRVQWGAFLIVGGDFIFFLKFLLMFCDLADILSGRSYWQVFWDWFYEQ
jgi:hypothetical protein